MNAVKEPLNAVKTYGGTQGHLLTSDDVAARMQVSLATVRRLVRRGDLPAVKIASRWRFQPHVISGKAKGERRGTSRRADGRATP